jgi:hypothetical protein
VAKKRNPTKIAVEEFLESQTIQPSFDPARFRMGEEKDRPTTRDYDAEAAAAAREAEEALLEAERQARVAGEGEKLAKVQEDLAATEAAKLAAEEAARKAKADADAAAAAAAKKAAEEAARLQAALDAANKAAADAANKTAAEKAAAELAARNAAAALAAANAANAASGNINVGNNVFIPATPAAGGMGASDILAKQYAEAQAQREKDETMQRQSITDTLTDRFTRYKLTGLIPTIKRLAQEGATESTITFALQDTEDYKKRFRANEERLKKGLTTAVQRVQNADPAISRTLRDYYGIGQTDLVAYVLDPNQQLQKIERQVAAAEIGTVARRQGLEAGVTVSEQLAAQGISQAQAQKGYATIADILPTSEKLSQIYGTTLEGYGQVEAEQEVFNTLASAQRKRQRLIGREAAEFSGQTGVTRGSLGTSTGGQY